MCEQVDMSYMCECGYLIHRYVDNLTSDHTHPHPSVICYVATKNTDVKIC